MASKDDVPQEYRSRFNGTEGIVVVGQGQEKTPVFRTEKLTQPPNRSDVPLDRADHGHGQSLLLLWHRRGLVGPFHRKFCSYVAYIARLSINGHEYVKRNWPRRDHPSRPWTMAF